MSASSLLKPLHFTSPRPFTLLQCVNWLDRIAVEYSNTEDERSGQIDTTDFINETCLVINEYIDSCRDGEGFKRLTREEVAKHNSWEDCWIIVDGIVSSVYNVTTLIVQRPKDSVFLWKNAGKVVPVLEFEKIYGLDTLSQLNRLGELYNGE